MKPEPSRSYIRVNIRHIGGGFRHAHGDLGLLPFQLVHPGLHRRLIHAILDGGDDPGNGALDLRHRAAVAVLLRPPLMVQPVGFLDIGANRFLHRLCGDQPILQPSQNPRLLTRAGFAGG